MTQTQSNNNNITKRKPLFLYPALPEIKLCFAVTIATVVYAWYCVYAASTKFQFKIGHMASVHELPLIGQRFRVSKNITNLKISRLRF